MYRRKFLSLAAPALALPAWFRFGEPHWFELTRTEVALPLRKPVRLLHVSDLHTSDGMTAEDLEAGLSLGLKQNPDLICFTGDFVSTSVGFDKPGLLRLLRTAAGTAPAFAVLGNHDGGAWLAARGGSASPRRIADIVQSAGIRLLHNTAATIGELTLVGVGDLWSRQVQPQHAFTAVLPGTTNILLSHNPDAKDMLLEYPWQLMLSGHTHGGQARIPGFTPPWAPVADKRFLSGLHRWEDRQLFVTRGLGSPKHVRAFCRPEISLLELTPFSA